ncbi:nuclear transport factor 2 family protein [Streptomyces sp. TRM66268-LWL]|uniref:Nuclear transport factor 2 family protein n=1 Tax=Streptomyces polyasparticus TaxID=2767826 RepID=A0ABR7SYH2_9ACTN|nr:nuclear transport factor 2 family protein [Streptomyces polyasparticus]MBC9719413.1 nuclear transport factor 2 family protein [Streptomyces polyasparticus]
MPHDVAKIFAAIDTLDPGEFITHLTEDVVFRFANAEPAIGREAVRNAVAGFFSTINGLTHRILRTWQHDNVVIVQCEVEYRRKDGQTVTVPNADILTYHGALVRDWQIYIDLAPVYAQRQSPGAHETADAPAQPIPGKDLPHA